MHNFEKEQPFYEDFRYFHMRKRHYLYRFIERKDQKC